MSDANTDTTGSGSEITPSEGDKPKPAAKLPKEVGGAPGPEPTRYGDWEHKGRCTDF